MKEKKKICVAGKNDIAIGVLENLLNKQDEFELLVICNKTETGEDSWQRSFRKYAREKGVREVALEEVYDEPNLIFLSMEFDQLIKTSKFKSDRLFNIHFSLLPSYKGMYTSAMPILNGEKITGVTLHRINDGIDTGDIIAQREIIITNDDTCRDLYMKYIKNGLELVLENIDRVLKGEETSVPQTACDSTYYSKSAIDYSDVKIDLNTTAQMINRQIRAFSFREYQMPQVFGKPIIVCEPTMIKSTKKPGTVLYENKSSIMLSTIDYNVILYKDRTDEFINACTKGDKEVVYEISNVKKHINVSVQHGWTPLMVATFNNRIEIVEFLISRGADIFAKNYNGTNMLMYAKEAWMREQDNTLFNMYLDMGISIKEKDYRNKDVEQYLKADGYTIEDILY